MLLSEQVQTRRCVKDRETPRHRDSLSMVLILVIAFKLIRELSVVLTLPALFPGHMGRATKPSHTSSGENNTLGCFIIFTAFPLLLLLKVNRHRASLCFLSM